MMKNKMSNQKNKDQRSCISLYSSDRNSDKTKQKKNKGLSKKNVRERAFGIIPKCYWSNQNMLTLRKKMKTLTQRNKTELTFLMITIKNKKSMSLSCGKLEN